MASLTAALIEPLLGKGTLNREQAPDRFYVKDEEWAQRVNQLQP